MTCSRALLSALWCALQLPCAARILLEGASNFHPLIPPRPRFQPEASSYLAVLWVRGCQLSGCGRTLQSPKRLTEQLRLRSIFAGRAAERPPGRERMASLTLQTLQDPIAAALALLSSWLSSGFPNPGDFGSRSQRRWRAAERRHPQASDLNTGGFNAAASQAMIRLGAAAPSQHWRRSWKGPPRWSEPSGWLQPWTPWST